MLAVVAFFVVAFLAAVAALALPARVFLGAGAGALVLVVGAAFFAGGGLAAALVAEAGLALALVGLVLETGLVLEAGLF